MPLLHAAILAVPIVVFAMTEPGEVVEEQRRLRQEEAQRREQQEEERRRREAAKYLRKARTLMRKAARQKVMDLKAAVANLLALPDGAFTPAERADAHIRLKPGFSREVKVLMRQLRDASWEAAAVLHADEEDERTTDEEVKAWLAKEQGPPEQPEQQRQQDPLNSIHRTIIATTAVGVVVLAAAALAGNSRDGRHN